MISTEDFSFLLTALYAAPLEPDKWHVFMDYLCALASISCGYLIGTYQGHDSSTLLAGGGANFTPEMFALYNEYYAPQDPYVEPLLATPRTGLIEGDALYDRAMLVKSEIYHDFLRRFELESTNALMCNCTHDQLEGLSLWRGPKQGAMDVESQRLLELLLPHLQMALRLRGEVMAWDAAQVFSEIALDAMAVAALLVTGNGRVIHMNGRAGKYLGRGEGLELRSGRLAAGNSEETAQLEHLLRAATSGVRSVEELPPGGAMRVLRAGERSQILVTVVPAPERNRIAGVERCAVVFVSNPNSVAGSRAMLMRQLYGLSPAECRLADLLLEGLDLREAAERMRITNETARFHLKRVFLKTDVRRQADLVRRMMALPAVAGQVIKP